MDVEDRDITTNIGTIAYMPPEVLAAETAGANQVEVNPPTVGISGAKWDVYSCGILIGYLLTRQPPFAGLNSRQILVRLCNPDCSARPSLENLAQHLPPASASQLGDLIKAMWADDPTQRPTFAAVAAVLATIPD